jgi:hypothetical protein
MAPPSTDLSSTDPEAYVRKIKAMVGDRDRIEILSETADVLAGIVAGHSTEQMRARPFDGKWTPNEIVGHLGDAEWVFGYRIRLILSEDEPDILGMDQEQWVSRQRHNEREPAELVQAFRAVREVNVSLWKRIPAADLKRTGRHNERGVESLDTTLTLQAGHDLSHIDQIRRYLAAITESRS